MEINEEIIIKYLNNTDLHDGMYVQSTGNKFFIYKIVKIYDYEPSRGAIDYVIECSYKISNEDILLPIDNGVLKGLRHSIHGVELCETTLTSKLNRGFNIDKILVTNGI
jgi:hypothetical protein